VGNIRETESAYRILMQKPTKKNQIVRPRAVRCRVEMVHNCVHWVIFMLMFNLRLLYRGADKSLAQPSSRCILFDVENISFDASLVLCIYSTNIPPIVIINRIYEHQNLLLL